MFNKCKVVPNAFVHERNLLKIRIFALLRTKTKYSATMPSTPSLAMCITHMILYTAENFENLSLDLLSSGDFNDEPKYLHNHSVSVILSCL